MCVCEREREREREIIIKPGPDWDPKVKHDAYRNLLRYKVNAREDVSLLGAGVWGSECGCVFMGRWVGG